MSSPVLRIRTDFPFDSGEWGGVRTAEVTHVAIATSKIFPNITPR